MQHTVRLPSAHKPNSSRRHASASGNPWGPGHRMRAPVPEQPCVEGALRHRRRRPLLPSGGGGVHRTQLTEKKKEKTNFSPEIFFLFSFRSVGRFVGTA